MAYVIEFITKNGTQRCKVYNTDMIVKMVLRVINNHYDFVSFKCNCEQLSFVPAVYCEHCGYDCSYTINRKQLCINDLIKSVENNEVTSHEFGKITFNIMTHK